MNIRRYEPWGSLDHLHREMDRLFNNSWLTHRDNEDATSDWVPAVDVKEEASQYVISADIPGVDPKNISVTMEHGILTISGKREHSSKTESNEYKRVETRRGNFYRRFNLPDAIDGDAISAKCDNGVLHISIPKAEKPKARQISVE
ncbi:MAG: Hsp20/alpha crystallin family protein [Gammaproteobacteria bacterium]|nr:Hsp20/alpha crystallin family protein [Gammaproteobacteria bacterium]MDH5730635.1 Hsp20/alpha crystallin family protein [Gammaproteobacteria bacterium]